MGLPICAPALTGPKTCSAHPAGSGGAIHSEHLPGRRNRAKDRTAPDRRPGKPCRPYEADRGAHAVDGLKALANQNAGSTEAKTAYRSAI